MKLRGIAHVHSTYSYDGCHALAELARFASARGLDFVLMSEHNRTLTPESMAAFVAECDALSDEHGVLMVPGIECEATPDYVHVLGYGVRALVTARDAGAIVSGIHAAGGFAVLAHPVYREALTHVAPAALAALDGFEVWNGKADGGAYPSETAIERLQALRAGGRAPVPMAGADLHRLEAYPGITIEVTCRARDGAAILEALARRDYRVAGAAWSFTATDALAPPPMSPRRFLAVAARDIRRRAKRAHAWLARRGLRAPAPLAHAARRVLR